jgi:antitoxin PrlF
MAKAKRTSAKVADEGDCCGADCCGGEAGCCSLPMAGCCEVEAVVTVDGRGQMVLPKEVREKAGIKAGAKLAVVAWNKGDQLCCLSLVPAGDLAEQVRKAYGPLLREITRP